jgi:hypothetical protein
MKLKVVPVLIGLIFPVLILSACKNYKGPNLFSSDSYNRLHYWGENRCLKSYGGCQSWVLYVQDDHKSSQVFHYDKSHPDLKSCATNCEWSYNRESGILTVNFTEYNQNYEDLIRAKLKGTFEWKDGEFGERFYSKSNPDVSIYME